MPETFTHGTVEVSVGSLWYDTETERPLTVRHVDGRHVELRPVHEGLDGGLMRGTEQVGPYDWPTTAGRFYLLDGADAVRRARREADSTE